MPILNGVIGFRASGTGGTVSVGQITAVVTAPSYVAVVSQATYVAIVLPTSIIASTG